MAAIAASTLLRKQIGNAHAMSALMQTARLVSAAPSAGALRFIPAAANSITSN